MSTQTWLSAQALVLHPAEGSLLMVRRSWQDTFAPGKWILPGGLIERDETPGSAAVRETLEETGILVRWASEAGWVVSTGAVSGDTYVDLVSCCSAGAGPLRGLIPERGSEARWVPLGELPGLDLAQPHARDFMIARARAEVIARYGMLA